jgi:hypothetical protein
MPTRAKISDTYAPCDSATKAHLARLVLIHDLALKACVEKDPAKLNEVLDVLQNRLNIGRQPSLGMTLFALYDRARAQARVGNFLASGRILAKIRASWTGHGKIAVRRFVR